jgi:hypothetical protein
MAFDLDEAERAALIELLAETIARDRFPRSPRIRTLNRILDKVKPPDERSTALSRKPRR